MRPRTAVLVVAALLLTTACGDEVAEPASPPATPTPPPAEEADMTVIEGTLGGDAELEGGCAWVEAGEGETAQRYEVLWPEGHAVRFDPLRLTDSDGEVVAEEGDTLRVEGSLATDMMSVCQVGSIFQATAVEAG